MSSLEIQFFLGGGKGGGDVFPMHALKSKIK